jgi:hypothetical protein
MNRYLATFAIILGTACAGVQEASATTILALTGDRTLLRIDREGSAIVGGVNVTGVNSRLLGIDVRPADGMLYGLFQNRVIATIDPTTGRATVKSRIAPFLPPFDLYSVDFNPVADRLRVVRGNNGANLRINVDTGDVTTDTPIAGPSPNPFGDSTIRVAGVAYTNSKPGPTPASTLLYDIDAAPGALYLQVPPNNGTLVPVGALGGALTGFGFDIFIDGSGRNIGQIVTTTRMLLEVDLAGGRVIASSRLAGIGVNLPIRDAAVLP